MSTSYTSADSPHIAVEPLEQAKASPGRRWRSLATTAATGLVVASIAGVWLSAASSPGAAFAQPTTPPPGNSDSGEAANFGAATPTDKFVQSFQEQVSQELQNALNQSNVAQEERLRAFEMQQREFGNHIEAIEQSVAAGRSAQPGQSGDAAGDVDWEPPRVNSRRPTVNEGQRDDSSQHPMNSEWPASSDGSFGSSERLTGGPTPTGLLPGEPAMNHEVSTASLQSRNGNVAPHGFIAGRLLNGVVAVTGGSDRESIVALSGDYHSANDYVSNLDGCFALVQGRPEIASGRIDFKLSRLTCNFPDGGSRTWDAAGWLVDVDGIRGVRAVIVDNTPRKAAVAAAGGAVGGIGQRLSQQQYEISAGPAGLGTSSSFNGSPARDAIGGAATGASNTIGQSIADYYNLYSPSLQVGGGTRVTVVLANEIRLPSGGRELTQTHVAMP